MESLDPLAEMRLVMTQQANLAKQGVLNRALAGEFGPLNQWQEWAVLGLRRDAMQAVTDATLAATKATQVKLDALTIELQDMTRNMREQMRTDALTRAQILRMLADLISGQLGDSA